MRKRVGFLFSPLPVETEFGSGWTYFLGRNDRDHPANEIAARHKVEPGDRLVSWNVWGSSPSDTAPGSVRMGLYQEVLNAAPRMRGDHGYIIFYASVEPKWARLEVDIPLDEYVGETLFPATTPYAGMYRLFTEDALGFSRSRGQLPERLLAAENYNRISCFYVEIDSAAPDGFKDIVVGEPPYFGGLPSILGGYTGPDPKPGDQFRHALRTRAGAPVTVRPDLSFTGTYPWNITPPQIDFLDAAYWYEDEWHWYVITLLFPDAPPPTVPPTNLERPSIEGPPQVGQTLTGTPGVWTGNPTDYVMEWLVNGVPTGVTTDTFTPSRDMYGATITLRVIAVNEYGETAAESLPFGPLGGMIPVITPFEIHGSTVVGDYLSFTADVDAEPEPQMRIEWFKVGSSAILATNTNRYRLRPSDEGALIYVRLTATNAEGTATYDAPAVGPITAGATGGGMLDITKMGRQTKIMNTLGVAGTSAQIVELSPEVAAYFAPSAGGHYYATLIDGQRREVVRVHGASGTQLYVNRGQDGTNGNQVWSAGTCFVVEWNPQQMREFILATTQGEEAVIAPGTYCLGCNTCLEVSASGRITSINGAETC